MYNVGANINGIIWFFIKEDEEFKFICNTDEQVTIKIFVQEK